ncbi:MAG: hypothetical protein ACOX1R_02265 [Caldicoprobacterales bacterium]|jgi:restriction endonuclease S subunit
MKLKDITHKIYSGQIITRVEAKAEIGDRVVEERKVLVPKAILEGRIIHSDLGLVKLKRKADENRVTKEGDIILKLSTPHDAVYIQKEDEGLMVPSFCTIIRGVDTSKADPRFITAYLNTQYTRELLRSRVAGSRVSMINLRDVKELEIPDVPLEKQKLIGEAYTLSRQKQETLYKLLENEKLIMNTMVLNFVKEAQ